MLSTLFLIGSLAQAPCVIDIPPGEAPESLNALADQCHVQLFFSYADMQYLLTNPVHGCMTVHAALSRLLAGLDTTVTYESSVVMVGLQHFQ